MKKENIIAADSTPHKQEVSQVRQDNGNVEYRATPRPQANTYSSPQPQVTQRAQTKYTSPQPYVSNSTAKKPVIKFTYGRQGQTTTKTDAYTSNASKASDVKSPSKGQYAQSYADTKSKGNTSYANQISTSRGSKGDSKAIDDFQDPFSPNYKPKKSTVNAFAKKPAVNESEVRYPGKNQYA